MYQVTGFFTSPDFNLFHGILHFFNKKELVLMILY